MTVNLSEWIRQNDDIPPTSPPRHPCRALARHSNRFCRQKGPVFPPLSFWRAQKQANAALGRIQEHSECVCGGSSRPWEEKVTPLHACTFYMTYVCPAQYLSQQQQQYQQEAASITFYVGGALTVWMGCLKSQNLVPNGMKACRSSPVSITQQNKPHSYTHWVRDLCVRVE